MAVTSAKALVKGAGAIFRRINGTGNHPRWAERAAVCEKCPNRVVSGTASYCGKPFLNQINRDPVIDGCGCPTREKAKDPTEHCPINTRHQAAIESPACDCKWCAIQSRLSARA